ncbi:MAG: phage portal protein [Patescibacteria group bacterium]
MRTKQANRKLENKRWENTVKQKKIIESTLYNPEFLTWVRGGGTRGIRDKVLTINTNTLRAMADKTPLVNSIINARINQHYPYTKFITEEEAKEGSKGFIIRHIQKGKKVDDNDKRMVSLLGKYVLQTGFKYDPEREDDFADYINMTVREELIIDQLATEIQMNQKGQPVAFWAVDGGTIKRTSEEYHNKSVKFVQEIEDVVVAEYSHENLIFDYMNKRVDLNFRGYGYSPLEQAIDVITTLLFGYSHLRGQFTKDKMPKGFISVMGEIDSIGISAIQQYWYSAMSGAGGEWNIPILPSGKDGVGLDFKAIGSSNRDMEYHKGMMFISSIIAAVMSIDLAEIGIKADDSTSLIGESSEPRVTASKERGLHSLLMFNQQYVNKNIRKMTTDYQLEFVGYNPEDMKMKSEIRQLQLKTDTSIDELRIKDGKKPYKKEWSEMPLNEQAVIIFNNMKAREKQEEQQKAQMEQQGQQNDNEFYDDDYPEEDMEKSMKVDFDKFMEFKDWQKEFEKRTKR